MYREGDPQNSQDADRVLADEMQRPAQGEGLIEA